MILIKYFAECMIIVAMIIVAASFVANVLGFIHWAVTIFRK